MRTYQHGPYIVELVRRPFLVQAQMKDIDTPSPCASTEPQKLFNRVEWSLIKQCAVSSYPMKQFQNLSRQLLQSGMHYNF
jgi:hypothetical protein